jgi:ATP-binding cassette, subfamily B, bacterial
MMAASLRPSKRWIVAGVVASLAWAGTKMVVPLLVRDAIDDGLDPYDAGTLLTYGGIIMGVTVLVAGSSALRRYAAFALSLRSEADLRHQMFAHLQRLHFGYHDAAHTGQLMARATTDLKQIQMMLIFIPVTGANVVMIVAVGITLLLINPRLTLVALISLPFLNLATVKFSRKIQPESAELQQRLAEISGLVEETVTGVRVVKGFGAEEMQNSRISVLARATFDQAMRIARLRANFTPLMEVLPTVGLVAVLYVGAREVIAGRLTVGELLAFNIYVLQLIFPLRILALAVAAMARGAASAARVYEVLSTRPDIVDADIPRTLPPGGEGEVRFEGVSFTYATGLPILENLTFTVRPGEAVALVGRTGSGKSTVARLLPRFYDATAGTIRLDGIDIRELPLAELRRAIGIVFEDTFLFTDTIRDNIAFAEPDANSEDVVRAAELAGAHEFISRLPEGYETMLGEAGMSLSGGQRQRIAIARAILARPRVLILDDATSAVDPTKEHEIREALEEVTAGTTTIIIGHRPATIALADRVLLIDGGRVAAEGSHEELLATSAAYRTVLAQAEAAEVELTGDAVEEVVG